MSWVKHDPRPSSLAVVSSGCKRSVNAERVIVRGPCPAVWRDGPPVRFQPDRRWNVRRILFFFVFAAVMACTAWMILAASPQPEARNRTLVCASIYSGDQTIHFRLDHPIPATVDAARTEFIRIGQKIQLRALASGDENNRLLGAALVQAATDGDSYIGSACYYRFPSGGVYYAGCDPDCSGPGCMGVKVRSIK